MKKIQNKNRVVRHEKRPNITACEILNFNNSRKPTGFLGKIVALKNKIAYLISLIWNFGCICLYFWEEQAHIGEKKWE